MRRLGVCLFVLVFFIVFLDQFLKVWIKTNMELGESLVVAPWFVIYFVENNGFAFGYEFWGAWGKVFLTLFRLVFSGFVFFWLLGSLQRGARWVVSLAIALVFAGAVGNIIDSVFYGWFFDYAPLFFGRVVDMFYFPLVSGVFPDWFPFWGGESFLFFRYVFNIADSSITVGAFLLLFFHKDVSWK